MHVLVGTMMKYLEILKFREKIRKSLFKSKIADFSYALFIHLRLQSVNRKF
jgi:hypothetical protein